MNTIAYYNLDFIFPNTISQTNVYGKTDVKKSSILGLVVTLFVVEFGRQHKSLFTSSSFPCPSFVPTWAQEGEGAEHHKRKGLGGTQGAIWVGRYRRPRGSGRIA